MEKINDFINRTNPNNSVSNADKINSSVITTEQKNDTFEKSKVNNNKKRNIVITAVIGAIAASIAFFKRKDIAFLFSNLFKKQSDISPKTPEIKPVSSIPIDKIIPKSSFEIQGLSDKALNEMQHAIDDLTIRVNDKQLNSGVGFIGENIEKREQAMNAFLDRLVENNYEVVKIPTINEKKPEEISKAIATSIDEAQTKFQQTGKRSILVVRDLDIIGEDRSKDGAYCRCAANLLNVEHCKENGYTWIWDAKSGQKIDKSLMKRSPRKIVI